MKIMKSICKMIDPFQETANPNHRSLTLIPLLRFLTDPNPVAVPILPRDFESNPGSEPLRPITGGPKNEDFLDFRFLDFWNFFFEIVLKGGKLADLE